VTEVVEAFPGEIESLSVSKPALEDVFIRRTGHKFWSEKNEGTESNLETRRR
jgi:ABC-2 type transport system ATP-binding protein